MSFAIIETGGKQYKVSASKILEIEKIDAEVGKVVKFKKVLLLNDDKNTEVGSPNIEGASVEFEKLEEVDMKHDIRFVLFILLLQEELQLGLPQELLNYKLENMVVAMKLNFIQQVIGRVVVQTNFLNQ